MEEAGVKTIGGRGIRRVPVRNISFRGWFNKVRCGVGDVVVREDEPALIASMRHVNANTAQTSNEEVDTMTVRRSDTLDEERRSTASR